MRFFGTVLAGAALFAGAMAQLAINDYPQNGVEAGKSYTITYSPKDQVPTEIILRQGPSGNLNTIATLGTSRMCETDSCKNLLSAQALPPVELSPGSFPQASPTSPTTLLRFAVDPPTTSLASSV